MTARSLINLRKWHGSRQALLAICTVVICTAAVCCMGMPAQAAAPSKRELKSGIEKLFDLANKGTPSAIAAARAHFDHLQQLAPRDPRIDYAYALVLINQHRYHDALPFLKRYVDAHPNAVSAQSTQLWALVEDRRYPDALQVAVALSSTFPQAGDTRFSLPHHEAAELMGVLFGYLDAVRPTAIDAELKSQKRDQILSRLGDLYLPVFDAGREATVQELAAMQAERTARQEKAVQAAEQRKRQIQANLDKDKRNLAATEEARQTSADQLHNAQQEIGVVGQQLASLGQDRVRLATQVVAAQTQLAQIMMPNNTVVNLTQPGNPQPITSTTTTSVSMTGFMQARACTFAISALTRQIAGIDRKILDLQSRGAQLTANGSQNARTIENSEELAQSTEKRTRALEKQIRSAESHVHHAAGPVGKMLLFSSYATSPYPSEKKRVLSWFSE